MKKDVVVVALILAVVGLTAFLVHAMEKERKAVKSLEEERYGRMVAEETLQKSAAKIVTLENQIKATSDKMAKVQGIMDQQKDVNTGIKKQYDQLVKAKEELEGKLQAVMAQQTTADVPATAPAQ